MTVEAAAPADMTFEAGAFQGGDITVESPKTPDISVTLEPPEKTVKKVVRDSKGHIKEIIEEKKQTVKRNPETDRIEGLEED